MIYHQYDKETGKYLGSGKCQLDPIEMKFLFPPFTTSLIPPKVDASKNPHFINGEWTLKDSENEKIRKLGLKNSDGVSIYKPVGKEVVEKTPEEISQDKETKIKGEAKAKARNDLDSLKSTILDRVIKDHATKQELDQIKEWENIINS